MGTETTFTIVIPTRDRCDTLSYAIQSALAQDYPRFVVLVSDNASEDRTREVVASFSDPRLRYVNTGRRVSMSHNWEFALDQIRDGWITIMGDDDALLPGALRFVDDVIQKTGVHAVRANGCEYSWPSLNSTAYGSLSFSLRNSFHVRSSARQLAKVLRGKLHYTMLPMLYNGGFADINLVHEAKAVTGSFFRSMTPDVYSAMVFSLLTDRYVYSNYPLAINGASHHSGGTAGFEGNKRDREYDPAEKFWSEKNLPFHPALPLVSPGRPVRSIQAIVYEAYLQAQPFHSRKQILTSPIDQLEIVLQTAGPHRDEVHRWAEDFAKLHAIDGDELVRIARESNDLKKGLVDILSLAYQLLTSMKCFGTPGVPLNNVYEASVVVGAMRESRVAFMKRTQNIGRRLQLFLKRAIK